MKRRSLVQKQKKASLSITSLMDVLTIILIFLLVNYSEVVTEGSLPEFISLPTIETKKELAAQSTKDAIVVVVGKNRIDVDKESIRFRNHLEPKVTDKLVNLLNDHRISKTKAGKPAMIALQADKNIPYDLIDTVLVSAGYAGITKIDFITLEKKK